MKGRRLFYSDLSIAKATYFVNKHVDIGTVVSHAAMVNKMHDVTITQ